MVFEEEEEERNRIQSIHFHSLEGDSFYINGMIRIDRCNYLQIIIKKIYITLRKIECCYNMGILYIFKKNVTKRICRICRNPKLDYYDNY